MKKLLNGFGALYRYPTLAVMLVVILLFWLAGDTMTPTEGVLYWLLAFLSCRFDRAVNRQEKINAGDTPDSFPESYIRASFYVLRDKEKELERVKTECNSFKNMYFQKVREEQAAKERGESGGDAKSITPD